MMLMTNKILESVVDTFHAVNASIIAALLLPLEYSGK